MQKCDATDLRLALLLLHDAGQGGGGVRRRRARRVVRPAL